MGSEYEEVPRLELSGTVSDSAYECEINHRPPLERIRSSVQLIRKNPCDRVPHLKKGSARPSRNRNYANARVNIDLKPRIESYTSA